MENQQLKQIIMRELPGILQRDPEVQEFILRLARQHFADREETESRFDRLLDELRRDREEQYHKWEEHQKEERARWEAQERKWEENQQVLRQMMEAIQALSRKHDTTIGALGARWGLYTEQSFRNALKGILEDTFKVEVLNVTEYDDEGQVFGRPDQVELDLIIKDGMLIICEIKSSMSKGDMYIFEHKARFYEKKHQQKASRLVVISPMVDKQAWSVAERLGIQVYSYAEDVAPAILAGSADAA